jgi:hypothetical protein
MGGFDVNKVLYMFPNFKGNFTTAIETGTLFGESTEIMSYWFDEVHTIEIEKHLYDAANKKFQGNKKINCHYGDSPDIIKKLSYQVKDKVLFFLDAHWSGDENVNWEKSKWNGWSGKGYNTKTGCRNNDPSKSENQNPLDKELETIVNDYKQECIIYIDDMDKFDIMGNAILNAGFEGEDWSHLSVQKIFKIVKPRLITSQFYRYELLLHLK